MVALVPVVELEPVTYATRERESPATARAADMEAWDRYWRDCLGDAGIVDLKPYQLGSWLVPVERLVDDRVLDALLDAHGEDDFAEPPGALSGGFVLETQSTTLEPQCCGDLANLDEWRRAAELKAPDWEMLWIGHPWAFVRAEGDRLWFSEPAEAPPVDGTALITVDRDALLAGMCQRV
jgi:hypothetical protein